MSEVAEVVGGEVVGRSLAENEDTIRRGLATFVDVGRALMEIRDERQFIEAGFDTFEDYCKERWDMAPSTASQTIGSAEVVDVIELRDREVAEWTVRPLAKLLNEDGEEAVRNAWSQIVERHDGEGPITGKEVRRFLSSGGANYGQPSWFELLGEVADTMNRAGKQLERVEGALVRRPNDDFRERAGQYAELADDLATRFRNIRDWAD